MATTDSVIYRMVTNATKAVVENDSQLSTNGTPINLEEEEVDLQIYAIVVPLVWGILTFVGALGNALVIYTLIRHGDKNATNYFVINLAISDFFFLLIVVPFTATLYVLPEWVFGNGMCKITMYMIYVSWRFVYICCGISLYVCGMLFFGFVNIVYYGLYLQYLFCISVISTDAISK